MIKIVTDSTCDLPPAWFKRYAITPVPINIQFGLETFQENETITPDVFYSRIQAENLLPTTSQPSIGQFCQIYERLAADGSEILSIHLTSKLSGTMQSALMAANQLKDKVKVQVIDSFSGSVGLGLMTREATQLVEAGLTINDIMPRLKAQRSHINVFIMLKDLRYARMSGRVGRVKETLVSLLNVKPIIGTEAGALIPLDRVRGQKKGLKRMVDMAREKVGDTPVYVGVAHAQAPAEAEGLLSQVQTHLNCRESFIADLSISLAVHFGPGAIGFATYPAE